MTCMIVFSETSSGPGMGALLSRLTDRAPGPGARSIPVGEDAREVGAKKEDLRRIIDPDQKDYERPGGSVSGAQRRSSDIQSNQKFSDREQRRGHCRADPDVVP